MRFPNDSDSTAVIFTSRDAYLKSLAWDSKSVKPKNLTGGEVFRLCNALSYARGVPDPKEKLSELVWITPVLGSGCATETTDASTLIPLDPAYLAEALSDAESKTIPLLLADGTDTRELVREFAQQLILDRLGALPHNLPKEATLLDGRVVLATALVTWLYHEVSALKKRAFHPRAAEVIRLNSPGQAMLEIHSRLISPLREVLAGLTDFSSDPDSQASKTEAMTKELGQLLFSTVARINAGLRSTSGANGNIRRIDIQILTELVWLRLIGERGRPVAYRGWLDLLAILAKDQEASEDMSYPLRPRWARLPPSFRGGVFRRCRARG